MLYLALQTLHSSFLFSLVYSKLALHDGHAKSLNNFPEIGSSAIYISNYNKYKKVLKMIEIIERFIKDELH